MEVWRTLITPVELWDAPKVALPRGRWPNADRRISSSVASSRGVSSDRGIVVCDCFVLLFLKGKVFVFFFG